MLQVFDIVVCAPLAHNAEGAGGFVAKYSKCPCFNCVHELDIDCAFSLHSLTCISLQRARFGWLDEIEPAPSYVMQSRILGHAHRGNVELVQLEDESGRVTFKIFEKWWKLRTGDMVRRSHLQLCPKPPPPVAGSAACCVDSIVVIGHSSGVFDLGPTRVLNQNN